MPPLMPADSLFLYLWAQSGELEAACSGGCGDHRRLLPPLAPPPVLMRGSRAVRPAVSLTPCVSTFQIQRNLRNTVSITVCQTPTYYGGTYLSA